MTPMVIRNKFGYYTKNYIQINAQISVFFNTRLTYIYYIYK